LCRSIKRLRGADPPASGDEVAAAALQYVRKVSGYRSPSKANQAAFDRAVSEVAASTQLLLQALADRERAAADLGRAP
jgi:hypothetical protein